MDTTAAGGAAVKNPLRSRWAWIWIGYTAFLFIQPIMEPSRRLWTITLSAFVVFLFIYAAYVRASDGNRPMRFWMIAATAAMGFALFPVNVGASTFFVYAASFLPFAVPSIRTVLALFGVEMALILAEGRWMHDLPNTLIAVLLIAVIGGGNVLFAQQRRAECALREAQQQNVKLAAVAERERIARDLHDVLGHTLSVITLKAELAARLLEREAAASDNVARAAAEIADVERTARTALGEVREAIGGYRARGLQAEVDAARRTLDAAGVTLVCLSGVPHQLPAEHETVLSLALREAVTNIVRHARASECTLRFAVEGGRQVLTIADNGCAQAMEAATRSVRSENGIESNEEVPRSGEGSGLRGMRERVESLGGALAVERRDGMRLRLAIPLSPVASPPLESTRRQAAAALREKPAA